MLIEANDPSVLDVMGFFKHLNTEELKDLLNDEGRLESMVRDCQKVPFATSSWLSLEPYFVFQTSSSKF